MAVQANVQENLPLTEATLFIILSLAPEPRHGYAIMKDVQALSEGRVVLSTGTLYGALKRLLEQGWIERVDEAEQGSAESNEPGRPRKAYTLTHLGKRVLGAEVARLQTLVAVARLRTARGQSRTPPFHSSLTFMPPLCACIRVTSAPSLKKRCGPSLPMRLQKQPGMAAHR